MADDRTDELTCTTHQTIMVWNGHRYVCYPCDEAGVIGKREIKRGDKHVFKYKVFQFEMEDSETPLPEDLERAFNDMGSKGQEIISVIRQSAWRYLVVVRIHHSA